MKRAIAFGCLMVFAIGITGCGGAATADSALKDRIKAMNDMADAAKAKDDTKLKDAEKRIENADTALDKFSKEDLGKAMKNNEAAWKSAGENVGKSGMAPDKATKVAIPAWVLKASMGP